jgi:uncharacterized protein YjbJ (UPF0337 family)
LAPPQPGKERVGTFPGSSVITGKTGASLPAVKPKSDRRKTMKSSTKDQTEGKFHKVKGKIKEIAGKITDNPKLKREGKDEKRAGKIQEKIGDIKKVVGK